MSRPKRGINAGVEKLIATLTRREIPPTQQEIRQVVELAYNIGKNDGAIEQCDKLLRPGAPT